MLAIVLFIICASASSIGTLVGAGGGIIIKPVLDMFGVMPVEAVSFCSGVTALCMSISSLLFTGNSGNKLEVRTSTPLALGAVLGGFIGKELLDCVSRTGGSNTLGGTQAICLTLTTLGILLYVCNKNHLKTLRIQNPCTCTIIGLVLGVTSSFLGIGGGPINLAVLYYFFSMDAHKAACNSIYIIFFSQLASITTAIVTKSVPDVSFVHLFWMATGGVTGALVGASISRRMENSGVEKTLRILLCVIVLINSYNAVSFFC